MDTTGSAVVTGGASGIGRALVLELADHGWDVAVLDLRQEPKEGGGPTVDLARETGVEAVHIGADVTELDSFRQGYEEASGVIGPIDCLVNNVGGVGTTARLEEIGPEEWREELALNLDSVYHGCRLAVPRFRERGSGIVINMASIAGLKGMPEHSAYSAAKAGVIGLTRSLAGELGADDLHAMAVCPGVTATAATDQQGQSPAAVAGETYKLIEDPVNGRVLRVD